MPIGSVSRLPWMIDAPPPLDQSEVLRMVLIGRDQDVGDLFRAL